MISGRVVVAFTSDEMIAYIQSRIDNARNEIDKAETGSTTQHMWRGAIQELTHILWDLRDNHKGIRKHSK